MITFGNIKKEHLPFLKKWRNKQKDILRQTNLLTDKDQAEWFKKIKRDKNQKLFAVYEGKKFIGYCGLVYIDFRHKRAEISLLTETKRAKNKETYGEDFISAFKMLCRHAFENLKLNKIYTDTIDFRKENIRILEKLGFKKEAVLKKHYFKKRRYCDSIIQSLFLKDWKKINHGFQKKDKN